MRTENMIEDNIYMYRPSSCFTIISESSNKGNKSNQKLVLAARHSDELNPGV